MLGKNLRQYIPFTQWFPDYRQTDAVADLLAALIVTIVLIPQSMAYAMLAGLPPQIGLYSALLPLLFYGLFGSSKNLAVGPVGLVSLMTGAAIADLNQKYNHLLDTTTIAIALTSLCGLILLAIRLFQLSSITKFLSHSVMSGFASAAAILIVFSQVKHLLGLDLSRTRSPIDFFRELTDNLQHINWVTAAIGTASILMLLFIKNHAQEFLEKWQLGPKLLRDNASKLGPFIVVTFGITLTWLLQLQQEHRLDILGDIPRGLPALSLPPLNLEMWRELFLIAALIAVIAFFESVSVAKALATRRRQRIDADQESIALSFANFGSALSGGMPVAGGFARSLVNFSAGAKTQMAGIFTAIFVAFGLLFITDVLYYLPRAVLAAIIMVAITQLIDIDAIKEAWHYSKSDASAIVVTFVGVIFFGIESGILAGVVFSIGQYLHRSSTPHIAVVGRVGSTEYYRNVERHQVTTYDHVLAIRVDESLYFANTNYLEERIINLVADNPDVSDVIIICSAINFIDSSALHSLETIAHLLQKVDIKLHFAAVKGPIMDRLLKSDFLEKVCTGRVYFSTHAAVTDLVQKHEKKSATAEAVTN